MMSMLKRFHKAGWAGIVLLALAGCSRHPAWDLPLKDAGGFRSPSERDDFACRQIFNPRTEAYALCQQDFAAQRTKRAVRTSSLPSAPPQLHCGGHGSFRSLSHGCDEQSDYANGEITDCNPLGNADAAAKRGDYAKALRLWRQLAEQGNVEAQFSLGATYEEGKGVPQDFQEAVKWYQLAAAKGYSPALNNLGVIYEDGKGVRQDFKEAVKWYQLAAAKGYGPALHNLRSMYEKGKGIPQDFKAAVKWYRLAAQQGNAGATKNLSAMYQKGLYGSECAQQSDRRDCLTYGIDYVLRTRSANATPSLGFFATPTFRVSHQERVIGSG
jgi:TPR repeat protein